jgi:hypothetical protein
MMVNWFVIGAVSLIAAVALVAWQIRDGSSEDDGGPDAQVERQPDKGATGGTITCPGGETVTSTLRQSEDTFEVVGTLSAFEGRRFTIDAPTGPMEMDLAFSADVEGEYALGDAMKVAGQFTDDGRLEADSIAPACSAYVGSVNSDEEEPSATPDPVSPTDAPLATDAAREPDDDDDGDDDEDNGDNRGRGNNEGNDGNRGNNNTKDDDDGGEGDDD